MKLIVAFAIIAAPFFFSACSSRDIIITDQAAYYVTDDSVSVMEGLRSVSTKTKPQEDTTDATPPIPTNKETPYYPRLFMENNRYLIEGEVWVKMWITKEGKVKRAYIVNSSEVIFNKACLEAAMQWEFTPATLHGSPIAVWISVPFRFRFHKKDG